MNEIKKLFNTKVIHAAQSSGDWHGATLPPIFQTASHLHPTAENLSQTFAGKTTDHVYMRLTNPTNRTLEEKLSALEGGKGAVVMSSGMAAITNTCMALLRAGDEFVAGNSLFMSTYLLFTNVFKKYGITARLVESVDYDAIESSINSKTRFIYLETIGNPKMDIPDLALVANLQDQVQILARVGRAVAGTGSLGQRRADILDPTAGIFHHQQSWFQVELCRADHAGSRRPEAGADFRRECDRSMRIVVMIDGDSVGRIEQVVADAVSVVVEGGHVGAVLRVDRPG